jgi:arylsulfatase
LADQRPQLAEARQQYTYYPGTSPVPETVAVKVLNRDHANSAHVEIPKGGAEGIILSHDGNTGGYSLFVKGRELNFVHNYLGTQEFLVSSKDNVPEGPVELRSTSSQQGNLIWPRAKGVPDGCNFT